MGHWTEQGFVAQSLSYYKSVIQQVFIEAFGSDFDLNDNLPQGVLIQRLAELFYGMDMDGVEAFARLNVNTMGGLFLDVVGNWRGIPRILGRPQTGYATITCNPSNFVPFTLPEGTVLTVTETGDQFIVSQAVTFVSNTANALIEYAENGNSSAIVGNTMSVESYTQIQNIEIISLFDGTDNESDISYRTRIQKEYPAAANTVEFVMNLLRAMPEVRDVGCLYNDTAETVGDLAPYSTEWIVAPTVDVQPEAINAFKEAVAKIIIDNKVPGSPTDGNTTVSNIPDVYGTPKTVKFSMAEEVPVEIEVIVTTPETTGILDLGGIAVIKTAVMNYINTLGIGKDVSYSRCIAPFAADTGFDVVSYKIKAVDSDVWSENVNFFITNRQYATITANNITVNV